MSQPEAKNQKERELVALEVLSYWASGDFKAFLDTYVPSSENPRPFWTLEITPQEFVNKWGEYIETVSIDLDNMIGEDLFGDDWEK